MIPMVKVVKVKALDASRIWVRFSDGTEGVRDLSDMLREGGEMVVPLRDPELFAKVFLEYGVPTWPNGFDMDAINLHMEMEAAGELRTPAAAK
jgi:Protein of unknown function (DUF2442)